MATTAPCTHWSPCRYATYLICYSSELVSDFNIASQNSHSQSQLNYIATETIATSQLSSVDWWSTGSYSYSGGVLE